MLFTHIRCRQTWDLSRCLEMDITGNGRRFVMTGNLRRFFQGRRCSMCAALFTCAVLTAAPAASGDVIYSTEDPFGGMFGLWGADVGLCQSVGLRFTPDGDYTLDRVGVWFMSNDFSGQTHPRVALTLRTDDDSVPGVSIPSNNVLEAWTFNVTAIGWNPVLEIVDSTLHPLLEPGVNYWIVAESQVACGNDGVWNMASSGTGFTAYSLGYGQAWQPGGLGAVLATLVEGTPLPPGDIDGDGDLDFDDLAAFIAVLLGSPLEPQHVARSDVNQDGTADGLDIRTFVGLMLGR